MVIEIALPNVSNHMLIPNISLRVPENIATRTVPLFSSSLRTISHDRLLYPTSKSDSTSLWLPTTFLLSARSCIYISVPQLVVP